MAVYARAKLGESGAPTLIQFFRDERRHFQVRPEDVNLPNGTCASVRPGAEFSPASGSFPEKDSIGIFVDDEDVKNIFASLK